MNTHVLLALALGIAVVLLVGVILLILERRRLTTDLEAVRQIARTHVNDLYDTRVALKKAHDLLLEHGEFVDWIKQTVEAMSPHVVDPTEPPSPEAATSTPAAPAKGPDTATISVGGEHSK